MAKVTPSEVVVPQSMDVGSGDDKEPSDDGGVRLKKELSLWNGIAIIVGVIVGSGVFLTPDLLLRDAGSKGMALIVWSLSGILSMIGALCYAELGTMIPKSGGDYAYIGEAFGPLPSFLYLWVSLFILVPCGNAVTALTFAKNILQPGWLACKPPPTAEMLIASSITWFLTAINCFNVKWVTRVQDSFTAAKVLALLITFFASLGYLFFGHTENLENMMEGTITSPGNFATAFYSGLFSYSGWNYLNFVTEELKDPYKNLPRAICISLPTVTIIYLLTNIAFFSVMSTQEIKDADGTVAVLFGEKTLGVMSWIMPVFVALCTIGSLNGAIYASSRLFFVGARNGHLPLAISLINIKRLTPVPSLIFMCVVTQILISMDTEFLVLCVSGVESLFCLCSVVGLLWMRHTRPDIMRPIRVSLIFPIAYIVTCIFCVILSCVKYPFKVGAGYLFTLGGIPVYYIFIYWQNKPLWLTRICDAFNMFCCKIFMSLPDDSKEL